MSQFLIKLILFVLSFKLLLFVLILFISKIHTFLPNDMYYYNEFEEALSENYFDILAIGNSRLLSSLDKKSCSF